LILILILSYSSVTLNTSKSESNQLDPVVKIGFLYPETGQLSFLNQGLLNAAIAGTHRINQTYSFDVILEIVDTQSKPEIAKSATQFLIDEGIQVIVGPASSASTLEASTISIPAEAPIISYSATADYISEINDNDYVFRVVGSDFYQGRALGQLIVNQSINSTLVVHRDDIYGTGFVEGISDFFQDNGISFSSISYDGNSLNFENEITTVLKSSSVDTLVLISFPEEGIKILEEMQNQNISKTIFSTDGLATSQVLNNTNIRDYLNGTLFGTSHGIEGEGNIILDQYHEDLNQTGGFSGSLGEYVYDAFLLAGAALNDVPFYNGAEIRNSLYKVAYDLPGASSFNKAFNCAGDPVRQSYDIWEASNYDMNIIEKIMYDSSLEEAVNARCGSNLSTTPPIATEETTNLVNGQTNNSFFDFPDFLTNLVQLVSFSSLGGFLGLIIAVVLRRIQK
jgi:branched-chain amino acid transport system substrate-binding protein